MRLGELLVQDRVITVAQLESALRAQILYGGRLGTNLIEAKVLTLDALAAALAKLHGVTIATPRQFDRIDPRTVALISRELAKRRLAIPLGITKTNRRLAVAFCDPRNQEAVAEIGFVCKMSVVPNVAPELRILHQLEKRYGVPRPNRYLRIVEDVVPIDLPIERRGLVEPMPEITLAVEVQAPMDLPKPPPPPPPPPLPKVKDGRPAAFEMPEVNMPVLRPPVPQATPKPQPAVAPPPPAPSPAPVVAAPPAPAPTPPPAPAPVAAPLPTQRPALGAADALAKLAEAQTRDEIGDLLADYLRSAFGVGIVFIVKQEMALGWKGFATGVDASLVEALALALASPSVLRTAWETGAPFRGAPPSSGSVLHGHFWKVLKATAPAEVVVLPIAIKGRVVNLVYAHALGGGVLPDASVVDLTSVCAAVVTAFSRLIQSSKSAKP